MASKIVVVLKSCLEHGLLVLAHPVDPVHLPLVALPDALQQLPLLLEALLWALHGDEGGGSHIASAYHVAESNDVRRNHSRIWRDRWQPQFCAKPVVVLNIL